MTEQHPITPPQELVEEWCYEDGDEIRTSPRWYRRVCAKAARWGADQQLELDAKWLDTHALLTQNLTISPSGDVLRKAMRPKPLSLKEQALAVVENSAVCDHLSIEHAAILRRALESLPE